MNQSKRAKRATTATDVPTIQLSSYEPDVIAPAPGPERKIIRSRFYKSGYELRDESVDPSYWGGAKSEDSLRITSAYSVNGDYIGDARTAYNLVVTRGIQPQLRKSDSRVCSIGYSAKAGKWYGWSHRTICGFKIGSTCRPDDCHYTPVSANGRGTWTAKTVADAKQMACDFAASVA